MPLNEKGREQARALAERARSLGLTELGASALRRARETAQICADALALPLGYTDPDLGERVYGSFEGKTRDELLADHAAEFAAWKADNRVTPPGAEPYEAMVSRMLLAATRAKRYADETRGALLLVSHGGAMRALVYGLTGTLVAPFENGALLRLVFEDERAVSVERL